MTTAAAGLLGPAVRWVVTDRSGGCSVPPYDSLNLGAHVGDEPDRVRRNRARLAELIGVPSDGLVAMRPAHGREVAVVRDLPVGDVPGVDALVTDRPGVALVALSADCVPVLLADPSAGVVAAVHSGWRGLAADVVGSAVAAMADLGAAPARLRAVVGPAICPACYPVPAERRDQVAAVSAAAWAVAADDRPALDLRAGIVARLEQLGVHATRVGGCTAEDPTLYSYRRDGVTGRHGAAVVLVGEDRL